MPGGPEIVANMTLETFLDYHFDSIGQDIDNAQTWQLAYGYTLPLRKLYANVPKDEVLAKAINTTKSRQSDVLISIRNKIYDRNDLDVALYEHVRKYMV